MQIGSLIGLSDRIFISRRIQGLKMPLPNFLFIGTGKAGSTSLYYYLNEHPDVYMSPVKETNFFSYEGGRPDFCGPGDRSSISHKTTITTIQDYKANFDGAQQESAVGEVSPSYLYLPKAPQRIKHYLPNVKMIVILRNPADRAYSNFQHKVRDNVEPNPDFSQVIYEEKTRIADGWSPSWHFVQNGFYATQLKRYFDLFDINQLKIYLFEDWLSDQLGVYKDILQFIGVDDTFVPNLNTRYNISGKPKSKALDNMLTRPNLVKKALKPILPGAFRSKMAAKLLRSNLKRLPKLSPSLRAELINIYRDDILQLQDLIDRNLSSWLEVPHQNA